MCSLNFLYLFKHFPKILTIFEEKLTQTVFFADIQQYFEQNISISCKTGIFSVIIHKCRYCPLVGIFKVMILHF